MLLVPKGILGLKVTKVLLVLREILDHRGSRVVKDLLVPRVVLVPRVTKVI